MAELSQSKLEEMVVGKPGRPNVIFFDKPVLDRAASEEAGRRVYVDQVMVKKTFPDVQDWVAERAQPKDFQLYPEEYERYKRTRRGTTSPGIEILPTLEPIHRQELIDYGLATIDKLVEANTLPPHLQYAQDAAVIMYRALKEVSNGNQEEGQQEEGVEEVRAGDVSPQGGREHRSDVGQPESAEVRSTEDTGSAERVRPSRREHGDQSLNANWSISFS